MDQNSNEYRKVGLFMWGGIICMPLIFAWFVFREGYSTSVRLIASLMLLLVCYILFIGL